MAGPNETIGPSVMILPDLASEAYSELLFSEV